ncbi:MAG: hypothetical protein C5S47_00310 [Candidatus Methanogasteraceae archaeon]|nr:MAG: hypothetical protein C5S47_00310 [ANME-2 cluster archaeon]
MNSTENFASRMPRNSLRCGTSGRCIKHSALSMYKDHRVTLWRAAEIAGVSLSEMLAELPKQKIIFQYDMGELNEDLEYTRAK